MFETIIMPGVGARFTDSIIDPDYNCIRKNCNNHMIVILSLISLLIIIIIRHKAEYKQ